MPDLATARRGKLLTQEQLAEKSGVSVATIYAIESGRTLPRLSVIARLCEVLGIEPTDIDEFRASIERKPRKVS